MGRLLHCIRRDPAKCNGMDSSLRLLHNSILSNTGVSDKSLAVNSALIRAIMFSVSILTCVSTYNLKTWFSTCWVDSQVI